MPTLKGTEASLSYVQCFWYLVFSSINASIFHIAWLDTFWRDHMHIHITCKTFLKFLKTILALLICELYSILSSIADHF